MDNSEKSRTITYLKTKWDDLFKEGTGNDEIFSDLIEKYDPAKRAYHNISHIANMFMLLGMVTPLEVGLDEWQELCLAILYHDSYGSERDSKDYMRRSLTRARGMEGDVDKIAEIILCTETHEHTGDTLTDILIDLDFSVLGSLPEDYSRYSAAIAKENITPGVSKTAYAFARIRVLESFLERGTDLFLSATFSATFFDLAQSNMKSEIAELKEEVI